MKTDDLIKILATNVEPTDRSKSSRELAGVVLFGAATSIAIVLLTTGLRSDLESAHTFPYLLVKLAFAGIIVGLAVSSLSRVSRPGGEKTRSPFWSSAPLAAVLGIAALVLIAMPIMHLSTMATGNGWLECLISIPVIAIAPFAGVVWFLRRMAPTDLTRAGAVGGILAGGMSAMGYALHCTDDSMAFIAIWYGGAIVLCALTGAILGPRLLRW